MMPRWLQKITKHGNSAHVSIPPQVLTYCGWALRDDVVLEPTEDKRVILRTPTEADYRGRVVLHRGRQLPSEVAP